MSAVGTQGLNLTCARTLILFESNWSAVLAHQLYGRIHRRGQQRPTFIFQLMASNTVDVLLIANGLAKKELLTNFTQIDRNLMNLQLLAGRAAPEDILALQGGDDVDEAFAKSIAEMLQKPKSVTGAALKGRAGSKPVKRSPRKRKGVELPETDGGELAPEVRKKRKTKSRPTVVESDQEMGDGEQGRSKPAKTRPKPRPKKANVGELAARAESVPSIERIEPFNVEAGTLRSPGPNHHFDDPVGSVPKDPSVPQQHSQPELVLSQFTQVNPAPPSGAEPVHSDPNGKTFNSSGNASAESLRQEALGFPVGPILGHSDSHQQDPSPNDQDMGYSSDGTNYPFSPPRRRNQMPDVNPPMEGIASGPALAPLGENFLGPMDPVSARIAERAQALMNFDLLNFQNSQLTDASSLPPPALTMAPNRFNFQDSVFPAGPSPSPNPWKSAFDGGLTPLDSSQANSASQPTPADEDAAGRIRPQHRNQTNAEAGPSSEPLAGEKVEYIPRKPVRSSQRALGKTFGKKSLAGNKRRVVSTNGECQIKSKWFQPHSPLLWVTGFFRNQGTFAF
ncbi:hypothetical protein F5890DRAFT_1646990 [Lentinula detonsa]|uniref:Helicase C-terminal domain-containing protein n=1 Tax=Lentinula detonsa TaxID=2804962 RepID=A0AA38ULM9_9AGAR|nr:hypothetical protein F5890DRAFT_1646990 [Lentinula detonsa]